MKEEITKEDLTIQVHGFFYKIPWYVLATDEDIVAYFGEDKDSDGEEIFTELSEDVEIDEDNLKRNLQFIRAIISLKAGEYYSFRYVKFTDPFEDRAAMQLYVNQFDDRDDVLTALKRELAFFAGMQYAEQKHKQHGTGQLH